MLRARIPVGAGAWPAWWAMNSVWDYPLCGEVDMMEYTYETNTVKSNVYDGKISQTRFEKKLPALGGDSWVNGFHTWTWEWNKDWMQISLDDSVWIRYDIKAADGTGKDGGNPFFQPMYMLLNLAIGGEGGGNPATGTYPKRMETDWIRVYQWKAEGAYPLKVFSGIGSGSYLAGTMVTLVAALPSKGKAFDRWTVSKGDASLVDIHSASTTFSMPAGSVEISAVYRDSGAVGIHSPRGRPGQKPITSPRGMPIGLWAERAEFPDGSSTFRLHNTLGRSGAKRGAYLMWDAPKGRSRPISEMDPPPSIP